MRARNKSFRGSNGRSINIDRLAEVSPSVLLISSADKLHNARCTLSEQRQIGDAVFDKFAGGKQTLWYYRALIDAYRKHDAPRVLVDELERTIAEMHQLAGEAYPQ